MIKQLKFLVAKTRNILRSSAVRTSRRVLVDGFKFTLEQIRTRPRGKFVFKAITILAVAFIASSKAVSYIEPKEAEVKINGQPILVAQKVEVKDTSQLTVGQEVRALRSPFTAEKPVDGHISQGFTRYHRALDITSPFGTAIRPVGPGVVEFAGFTSDGKGNIVIVDHGDGLKTLYAHMGKIYVGVGNVVSPTSDLGTVGLTGRTTGPHVHFEVIDRGAAVNPLNLL